MSIVSEKGTSLAKLVDNGTQVSMLQTALSRSETNARTIPTAIINLIRDGAWQKFVLPTQPDEIHEWRPADFRRFIESKRPSGCQTPISLLERLLRGTKAWETFLELTRGEPGGNNNPYGAAGKPDEGINCDIITVDSEPTNSPPPTGTSVSYALRRLKKNRPDLYELVKAGDMSANAAMIEAGFRKVHGAVYHLMKWWNKATLEQRNEFLNWTEAKD